MTILVQDSIANGNVTGSTSSVTATVTKATTAGNAVLAAVGCGGGRTITSVTDPRGNTWAIDVSGAGTDAAAICAEFLGTVTVDKSASNSGSSSSPSSGNTATTTAAHELLYGGITQSSLAGDLTISAPTSALTTQRTGTGNAKAISPAYQEVTSTGAYATTGSFGADSPAWAAAIVTYKVKPRNTVAPSVSGSTPVGSTLSTTNGTWLDNGSPTFTYQWTRDGSNIGAATSSTYVTQAADVGHAVGCTVTDTDSAGSASQASSNTITVTAATSSGFLSILIPGL